MPQSEKQRAFLQSVRDQAAAQAYSNVKFWLEAYPFREVLKRVTEKQDEIFERHPTWRQP